MVNTAWESIHFSRAPSPSASYVLLGSGVNSSHKFFIPFSQKKTKQKVLLTVAIISFFYTRDPPTPVLQNMRTISWCRADLGRGVPSASLRNGCVVRGSVNSEG